MPSVTLPCHMSLFHSVTPQRHGITTNLFVPQVRPVKGICEVLRAANKKCAMFYDWEELRDLSRPGSLIHSYYFGAHGGYEKSCVPVTDAAKACIGKDAPDFVFLYIGWPDEAGHNHGWMGEEYIRSIYGSFDRIESIVSGLPSDYLVIYTADHGGHDRSHGCDIPEDMTIPIMLYHPSFRKGALENANIIDQRNKFF